MSADIYGITVIKFPITLFGIIKSYIVNAYINFNFSCFTCFNAYTFKAFKKFYGSVGFLVVTSYIDLDNFITVCFAFVCDVYGYNDIFIIFIYRSITEFKFGIFLFSAPI